MGLGIQLPPPQVRLEASRGETASLSYFRNIDHAGMGFKNIVRSPYKNAIPILSQIV